MRLTERETAAWCVVRGIDYLVEECPMAAGNKHLGYKAGAERASRRRRRAPRPAFYLGFLERMAPLLAEQSAAAAGELARCERCGAPTTGVGVRVLPPRRDPSAHEPCPSSCCPAWPRKERR